jgi:dihydrofolate reductase
MRKIILYSAISTDNFIAREDGNIDWLNSPEIIPEGEDFGYNAFYNSIGTTLIGNSTYKQVLGFSDDFPYPDKENYVFTRDSANKDSEFVQYISTNVTRFCRNLKAIGGLDIWLVGGGKLNSSLLKDGLIDKLILTSIPIALGKGIPLFDNPDWQEKFKISTMKSFPKGIRQIEMIKSME